MKKKIVLVIVLALLVLPAFFVSAQPAQDDDLEKIGCNTIRCQLENLIKILQDRIRELLAENNDNGIWTIGEGSKSLRWTQVDFGSPDNKVDIYLKSTGTNAGVPLLVDLGVPNNGRYSWSKVGRGYQALNVPAGSYLVRVCARNVAQNCRDYDEISVVSSNLGIKLTSPVQNDALARGESQAITWTAGSGVSAIGDMKVNIHMRKVGAAITDQYRFSLAKNEPNDGSFTWTKVGMSSDNRIIPDGKYFITVCVSGSSGFACDSAKVELRTATAPSSNLAAPNISIDQTNDLVKVKFVNGPGSIVTSLRTCFSGGAQTTCQSKTYSQGSSCDIKMIAYGETRCRLTLEYATSDTATSTKVFTVNKPASGTNGNLVEGDSSIVILEPHRGLSLKIGQSATISWDSQVEGPYTIYLVGKNSQNVETFYPLTSTATGKSFVWTIVGKAKNNRDIPAGVYDIVISQNADSSIRYRMEKVNLVQSESDSDGQNEPDENSISLTNPSASNLTIKEGETVEFAWSTGTSSPVTLYLVDVVSDKKYVLVKSTLEDSYKWVDGEYIGATLVGEGKYRIVVATVNGLLRDNKHTLTIEAASAEEVSSRSVWLQMANVLSGIRDLLSR